MAACFFFFFWGVWIFLGPCNKTTMAGWIFSKQSAEIGRFQGCFNFQGSNQASYFFFITWRPEVVAAAEFHHRRHQTPFAPNFCTWSQILLEAELGYSQRPKKPIQIASMVVVSLHFLRVMFGRNHDIRGFKMGVFSHVEVAKILSLQFLQQLPSRILMCGKKIR